MGISVIRLMAYLPPIVVSPILVPGQDPTSPPSFEVAVVRANKSGEPFPERKVLPSGQLVFENYRIKDFIAEAWNIREDQIMGGPNWISSDRFDVTAKVEPGTPESNLRVMLQNLLAERFKLVIHKEEKVLAVFALTTAKGGPRLTPTVGTSRTTCRAGTGSAGQLHRLCTNMTMAVFAEWLPKISDLDFDVPVLDFTGITGAFDLQLDWSPPLRTFLGGTPVDPNGPTIFEAVRALGLNLERRKLPTPVVVIDHVDRTPMAN